MNSPKIHLGKSLRRMMDLRIFDPIQTELYERVYILRLGIGIRQRLSVMNSVQLHIGDEIASMLLEARGDDYGEN